MKIRIAALAALPLLPAAFALASPPTSTPSRHGAAKPAPVICPVTGDKIASPAKAYNKETYKGKTYYFCCPECKPRFDKNRVAIIKHAAQGKYEKM